MRELSERTGSNMMNEKRFAAALCGALLAGCLSGCGPLAETAEARNCGAELEASSVSLALSSEDGGQGREAPYEERFQPYAPFGLLYDAEKNELLFHGEPVRWFEDYYPVSEDGGQAGIDFFNENGVVDVHAVRDRSVLARKDGGSYDPSGVLTGVEAFSEEDFAARDIEALRNPKPVTAVAGGAELSEEELKAIAEEYAPFGVTYDAGERQWYYNGEAVCYLRDVLSSNGKSLTGGGFQGVIRTLAGEKGGIRIETVRDFTRPNSLGYGTLTGIQTIQDS